jgi:HEAT repeat protein
MHRTNGSSSRPVAKASVQVPATRSRLAARIDQIVNQAMNQPGEVPAIEVAAAELLAEPVPVGNVLAATLNRPDVGLAARWRVHESFRRAGLVDVLLNSLADPNPAVRASAARICGALGLSEAVQWIGDLAADPDPKVREAAVRSLGRMGGSRSVDILVSLAGRMPLYRLAACLAEAASDVDVEALMRKPPSERAAAATIMACGLRKDVLRVPPLLGIAHDRRWPRLVRLAACRALAMISDPAATGGLRRLADIEPDPVVKAAAERSHRRLVRAAGRSWK